MKKINFLLELALALTLSAPTLFGAAAPTAGGGSGSGGSSATTDIVVKSAADCWLSTCPDAVRRWEELAERKGFKLVGFIQGARTNARGERSLHAVLIPLHEASVIPWLRGIPPFWVVWTTAETLPSKHALSLANVRRSNGAGQLISKPDPDILAAIMKTIQDNVPQLLDYDLHWLMNAKLVDITSCPAEIVGGALKTLQDAAQAEYNSDRRVDAYEALHSTLRDGSRTAAQARQTALQVACDHGFDGSRLNDSYNKRQCLETAAASPIYGPALLSQLLSHCNGDRFTQQNLITSEVLEAAASNPNHAPALVIKLLAAFIGTDTSPRSHISLRDFVLRDLRTRITSKVLCAAVANPNHAPTLITQFLALFADDRAAQQTLITSDVLSCAAHNLNYAPDLITQLLAPFAGNPRDQKACITSRSLCNAVRNHNHASHLVDLLLSYFDDDLPAQQALINSTVLQAAVENPNHTPALVTKLFEPFTGTLAAQKALITSEVLELAASNPNHAPTLIDQLLSPFAGNPADQINLITPKVLYNAVRNRRHAAVLVTQILAPFAGRPTAKKAFIRSRFKNHWGKSIIDIAEREWGQHDIAELLKRALDEE